MNLKQTPDLPKRLTISFPIWGLFDVSPDGAYHDLEKMVREHVERGFNCIRLEGGAGLTHDSNGKRLPPTNICAPFGALSTNRQAFVFGGEGKCDVMERLIALCRVCKENGVYLILSSWYFLHTYWYVDEIQNKRIFSLLPENMFLSFAKFLDYILVELEERQLDGTLAFVELFNEVNAFPDCFPVFFGKENVQFDFRQKHEEALSYLQTRHPQLLFGLDSYCVSESEIDKFPRNFQVFNGHNYFMWDVYHGTLEGDRACCGDYFHNRITPEDIIATRNGKMPLVAIDWYVRLANSNDVDAAKIPSMEKAVAQRFEENRATYIAGLNNFCEGLKYVKNRFPDAALVCGEGVTYCSHKDLLWEEKSDGFWEMVTLAMDKYREIGLWGSVVKTCCGPEDPCWSLCADRLRWVNQRFLTE